MKVKEPRSLAYESKDTKIPRLGEKIHLPSAAMLRGQRAYSLVLQSIAGQGGDATLM